MALDSNLAQELTEKIYVFSCSLDGDSLNQWIHYASGQGVAIGLTPSRMEQAGASSLQTIDGQPTQTYHHVIGPGWHVVDYDGPSREEIVRSIFKFISNSEYGSGPNPFFGRTCIKHLMCSLKHPAFSAEREVRYVIERFPDNPSEKYRVSGSRLIPFVPICDQVERVPMVEVVVGPTSDPRAADSVRRLLASSGYPGVPVRRSQVPLAAT